ncbi:MAG: hypothetical protein A3D67_03190 [Candidatus Lloydbacteria bacterium RIFCSPHIGHO2_02_FULL_51_22]|uniref:Single-stranded DNA-binding protein n=3 Tax=Candidatus Lloydiibacteriota TaxID=1817910 RepID=A0A1G2DAG0_9BACT|nr:MAG: hypothetical protein A3D67_03190 [Candidatus Lloydbacteria bacterium RIFCSPHIGHO2_02_FULL_51_22]OGZ15628.1 MAG: hypothetical protein A3J08_00315 [Candidatus Lloydbacteria bacterium RIFCSPLOWO2_02_FULL_51_11]OGZ15982.1 MAG: hypothetical protein A3G11_01335 [Candidatus Lloydbacteria bacterium RIFCSPLOWO2_12_FULL_51_9]
MYINKAFIFGNLTRDPELRSLPSGQAVANFAVATNSQWRDKDGNKKENTEFHNVVTFGKQAELVSQYLRKGGSVFVEGRLQTRSWDDASGAKKYRTEIVADKIQFGPRGVGGSAGGTGGGSGGGAPKAAGVKDKEGGEALETIEYPEEENKVDDIPF